MKLTREDDRVLGLGSWIFALFAVVFGFSALWIAADARTTSADAKQAAALGSGTPVTLSEYAITPTMIDAVPNSTLAIKNGGTVEHNFAVTGTNKRTPMIKPGTGTTLSLSGLKPGTYTVICEVPGHAGSGMKATLMIGGGGGAGAAPSGSAGGSASALLAENARMDATQKKVVDEYVGQLTKGPNTKGVGNQPMTPTVLADGTKEFDMTAKVIQWEVEP